MTFPPFYQESRGHFQSATISYQRKPAKVAVLPPPAFPGRARPGQGTPGRVRDPDKNNQVHSTPEEKHQQFTCCRPDLRENSKFGRKESM